MNYQSLYSTFENVCQRRILITFYCTVIRSVWYVSRFGTGLMSLYWLTTVKNLEIFEVRCEVRSTCWFSSEIGQVHLLKLVYTLGNFLCWVIWPWGKTTGWFSQTKIILLQQLNCWPGFEGRQFWRACLQIEYEITYFLVCLLWIYFLKLNNHLPISTHIQTCTWFISVSNHT